MHLSSEELLHQELTRFLNLVTALKRICGIYREERLVFSLKQDLCLAVSEAVWKLPKHVIILVSVMHLFRSDRLTTIQHRTVLATHLEQLTCLVYGQSREFSIDVVRTVLLL